MSTIKDDTLDELKDIIRKNNDAREGYAKAAEHAERAHFKNYFRKKSQERARFNEELQGGIGNYVADFKGDTSFLGNIHRGWMDLKAMFSSNDEESMLEEALRGDKNAVKEYDDVLEESLPMDLRDLLMTQRSKIQSDIENNDRLEDKVD